MTEFELFGYLALSLIALCACAFLPFLITELRIRLHMHRHCIRSRRVAIRRMNRS